MNLILREGGDCGEGVGRGRKKKEKMIKSGKRKCCG